MLKLSSQQMVPGLLISLLVIAACDEPTGICNSCSIERVTVIAEVRQADNSIGYTIANRTADTIFLDISPRAIASWLERRVGATWQEVGIDVRIIDVLLAPVAIGPGEDFEADSSIDPVKRD